MAADDCSGAGGFAAGGAITRVSVDQPLVTACSCGWRVDDDAGQQIVRRGNQRTRSPVGAALFAGGIATAGVGWWCIGSGVVAPAQLLIPLALGLFGIVRACQLRRKWRTLPTVRLLARKPQ
ncbi:MAG TPA: hypothetical protein VFP84_10950 [Kofleriaceae bacterium]|nr:hypothetical protein [Kofleriaceae bacterium]